ncbi:hypothetical protein [Cronobacter sakazakii]
MDNLFNCFISLFYVSSTPFPATILCGEQHWRTAL